MIKGKGKGKNKKEGGTKEKKTKIDTPEENGGKKEVKSGKIILWAKNKGSEGRKQKKKERKA